MANNEEEKFNIGGIRSDGGQEEMGEDSRSEEKKEDNGQSEGSEMGEEEVECYHEWEGGRCELCGEPREPLDFSGASEGDR